MIPFGKEPKQPPDPMTVYEALKELVREVLAEERSREEMEA